jgi:hypothetical protein
MQSTASGFCRMSEGASAPDPVSCGGCASRSDRASLLRHAMKAKFLQPWYPTNLSRRSRANDASPSTDSRRGRELCSTVR